MKYRVSLESVFGPGLEMTRIVELPNILAACDHAELEAHFNILATGRYTVEVYEPKLLQEEYK